MGLHALASGTASAANGGDFESGFVAGGFSQWTNSAVDIMIGEDVSAELIGKVMTQATAGAMQAKLTGGDLLTGAITAGFSRLYSATSLAAGSDISAATLDTEISEESSAKQLGPIWFKPNNHEYTVGRLKHWLIYPGSEKFGIGMILDVMLPAAHAFGAEHDNFVRKAVAQGYSDLVVNVPSMFVMYPKAILQEMLNTPAGVINMIRGSSVGVPFPHRDP